MARDNFSPSQQVQAARQAVEQFASDPMNPIYIAARDFLAQQGVILDAGQEAVQEAATGAVAQEAASQSRAAAAQARSIGQQFARPPRNAEEAAARVRALARGREALLANPSTPQAVRDQVEALLSEAEAAQESLRNQQAENLEYSQGIVGGDQQVDAVAGRPVSDATREQVPTVAEYNAGSAVPQPTAPGAVVDPRGTVDAQTVAGTPRPRRAAGAPVAPAGPQGKVEGPSFPDPYDPRGMYESGGPFDEIRDTFQQEGKIKQEAGLQSEADIMAAAQEIKSLRSQAFQRMGEDLVAQEQRLRELDLQLSALREMRFDSDRLFRNRGHGVSLALGMAVGAMQQTISNILYPGANVPNTAMQLVQDAIDRDLREQAVNYQRAQTEIGMGRTAYEMARQMGMDHTAAYEYARAGAQEYVASQLQATRMRMGAGVAAEQMHRAEQELRLQAMDRKNMALMAMAQAQAPRVSGGGARQGVGGVPIAPRARLIPGMTAERARTQIGTQTWNNIQSTLNGGDRVLSILDQMSRILTSGEGEEYLSRARGTLESLVGQLTGAIKESMQLGALDNGVLQLREMIIGDPTAVGGMSLWKQRIRGQMQALRAQTARTIESTVRFNGQGLIEHDANLIVEPNTMPDIPGFEATDEETPASGMEGRMSTAVQAVVNNPVGAFATVVGGTGPLGQSIEQGMRDLLE